MILVLIEWLLVAAAALSLYAAWLVANIAHLLPVSVFLLAAAFIRSVAVSPPSGQREDS